MGYLIFFTVYVFVCVPVSFYVMRPIVYTDQRRRELHERQSTARSHRFPLFLPLPPLPTRRGWIIRPLITFVLLFLSPVLVSLIH